MTTDLISEHQSGLDGTVTGWATFSRDRIYRYVLGRRWTDGPTCLFVMLNPSIADAFAPDPTVRRCLAFAMRERCGALEVVNLYALRSPNPQALARANDPVGPWNDATFATTGQEATLRIAAWGVRPARIPAILHEARVADALKLLRGHGDRAVHCLGRTKAGHPRHPLYLPDTAALEPY